MKLVIIGAGIIGRFAKTIMPDALLFESKKETDKITIDYLGTNMSRLAVPELDSREGLLHITINGEMPSQESLLQYRRHKFSVDLIEFGDYKQFNPLQRIHFICKPEIADIHYGFEVRNINAIDKVIEVFNSCTSTIEKIAYDAIISTMPLNKLIDIVDITRNSPFLNAIKSKFIFKKIFYKEETSTKVFTPSNEIILDFRASENSSVSRFSYYTNRKSTESFFDLGEGCNTLYPGKVIGTEFTEEIAKDLQLYNIYCYGRFARWRHKEMLHETFKNIRRFCERKGQIGYGG